MSTTSTFSDTSWIGATALFEEEADTKARLASLEADLEWQGERVETEALEMPPPSVVPTSDAFVPRPKATPAITASEIRGIVMGTVVLSGWISLAMVFVALVLFR